MWKYELYYDGAFITEDDGYEIEEEANEAAEDEAEWRMEMWKLDGGWTDRDSIQNFDYNVEEV